MKASSRSASEPARGALPGEAALLEVAARDGIDAATRWLYQRVLESPHHGPFIRRIDVLSEQSAPESWNRETGLVIVPAASYRENPGTGADGSLVREQAERMGCPTELIPISTTGSVQVNARLICDWLAVRDDRPLILASLSKGGPDLKVALLEPDAEHAFRNVIGWINLCGILDGTPIADWLLSPSPDAVLLRLYFRLRGQNPDFLRDLRYRRGGLRGLPLRLPPRLRLLNVVGFPLREHLSRRITRRCHARLERFGPNDGGVILADVCALPGLMYPIWGADHYLQPKRDVRSLMRALLLHLSETAEE